VAALRALARDFGHCLWGAHPRTVLCAQAYRLSMVDLRAEGASVLVGMPAPGYGQASTAGRTADACTRPGRGVDALSRTARVTACWFCLQAGRFYALGRPSLPDGAAQPLYAAVTTSFVCIFDIRQPATPFLRWQHHQAPPPPLAPRASHLAPRASRLAPRASRV